MKRELIALPPETRPILTVVIHTEEEFDWSKPHNRNATGVEHMRHIDRAQTMFDEFGIVPNYVVDCRGYSNQDGLPNLCWWQDPKH